MAIITVLLMKASKNISNDKLKPLNNHWLYAVIQIYFEKNLSIKI